jgi:hypothetical protein
MPICARTALSVGALLKLQIFVLIVLIPARAGADCAVHAMGHISRRLLSSSLSDLIGKLLIYKNNLEFT